MMLGPRWAEGPRIPIGWVLSPVCVSVYVGVLDGFSQGRGGVPRLGAREGMRQHPYLTSALWSYKLYLEPLLVVLLPLLLTVRAHRTLRSGGQLCAPDG